MLLCIRLVATATANSQADAYHRAVMAIQQQIENNQLEQARTMIASASKQYPHDGGLENLLGVVEIEEGHTAEARVAFTAAIAHDPRLTSAYLNLSRIEMQTAATDTATRTKAQQLSARVLQLDPANDEARYEAANIYFWNKEYRRSLEDAEKLSAQAQAQVGAQALVCADDAFLKLQEAAGKAARALAANTELTEQDAHTCIPALKTARRADLIETLLKAVENKQTLSPAGLRILGLAQEAQGELPAARATLEQAFAASQSVVLLEDLTRVAKAQNDDTGALGYLAHARDLSPNEASLPYEYGVICMHMGLLEETRKAINEALRLEPENPLFNLSMGIVISFSDDPSQAFPYLTKYHALRPGDAEGELALGSANFRAKDYDTAQKWLHQATTNPRTAADAHFYLGRIARQQGQFDDAQRELKLSLTIRANQPDALAELGQIDLQQQHYAQAEHYFDAALRADPDNYTANYGLLQIYARTGDGRREQQSQRFNEIKSKKDERDRQMMRVIEIHRDAGKDGSEPSGAAGTPAGAAGRP